MEKLTQKAQEMLGKMFSGFMKKGDIEEARLIVEGEVVDESEGSN